MSRLISCCQCDKNLGEIRDAKLMKGIAYLCSACENTFNTMKTQLSLFQAQSPYYSDKIDYMNLFKDIFK